MRAVPGQLLPRPRVPLPAHAVLERDPDVVVAVRRQALHTAAVPLEDLLLNGVAVGVHTVAAQSGNSHM